MVAALITLALFVGGLPLAQNAPRQVVAPTSRPLTGKMPVPQRAGKMPARTGERPVLQTLGETPVPHAPGPGTLEAFVPADAMAVYFGRPSVPTTAPAGVPTTQGAASQLSGWVVTLKAMGVIPRQGRWIADLVGTLPILTSRPHAAALLDITAKQLSPESYRLSTLQAGFIIDSTGIEQEIDRRVRDLLATYSDTDSGKIETLHAGPVTYHRFTDSRLDAWAVAEWASVGPYFVAGFGEGAFPRMLAAMQASSSSAGKTLAEDAWFARAHAQCHGPASAIEAYVDVARIRTRVGEVVKGRPEEVLRTLNLASAERLLWTLGYDGRALRSEVVARTAPGADQYAMLTGREVTDPAVTAAIPPAATRYAAFHFPLGPAVLSARDAYLQSRSDVREEQIRTQWGALQEQYGFDAQTGLLDRLGDYLVMHNYPPHPLSSSLLLTIWLQHHGQREQVAATVDGMMHAWQTLINVGPQTRPAFRFAPQVNRTDDGIWYLQLGLVGPAIAVADGWIVISYSPEAVRANLAYLR
jgi:hypothetical protein